MSLKALVHRQLAQRAPRLEHAAQLARWKARNRSRRYRGARLEGALARIAGDLKRDGIASGSFEEVFGSTALFHEAEARARELLDRHRDEAEGSAQNEAKPYLTKLLTGRLGHDDVFTRLALHENVLAIANDYLGLRGLLRAADVWLTRPTEGEAIQTQLWHRDGDDLVNVKMFVYFTEVTDMAGPFCYAPGTHPYGNRRRLPERDDHGRSTDAQMAAIVPSTDWIVARGTPSTVVFADTCGYHKQIKPTTDERLLFMCQFVSGTAYVPLALEVEAPQSAELSEDQRFAMPSAPRGTTS